MENKKGSLSTVFLVIAIMLIIVMGVFMYMQKTEADRQIAELENNASEMQETINDLQGKIDSISNTINSNKDVDKNSSTDTTINNTNSTQYIEMTEENYKKYNTLPNYFRIQEMIDNKNGTITIRGRVFQETELLKITREQYGDLLEGKVIDLLGYQMKVNKDEDPNNGGYDMLITSTIEEKWLKFYLEKNTDGSGKLHYYTEEEMYRQTPFKEDETGRFIGTNTYLQITLDDNLKCESGNASTTLREEFNKSNGILNINKNDDIKLPYLNDEFNFENGKCVSIRFSGV